MRTWLKEYLKHLQEHLRKIHTLKIQVKVFALSSLFIKFGTETMNQVCHNNVIVNGESLITFKINPNIAFYGLNRN